MTHEGPLSGSDGPEQPADADDRRATKSRLLPTALTNPEPGDRNTLVDSLARAYYPRFVSTQEPLGCVTPFHLSGMTAPVYTNSTDAEDVARVGVDVHGLSVEVTRISGLWDFFILCADCGFEGAVLNNHYPLTFFNRLSDMNRSAPTLAWVTFPESTNSLQGFFFSRTGLVEPPPGSTIKWQRQERMDKAWNRFVLQGQALAEAVDPYVITDADGEAFIFDDGATFLGPYVTDTGAVSVFTDPALAAGFAQRHGLTIASADVPAPASDGCLIRRVDLLSLLERVHTKHAGAVDVGLNPGCHRYRQGWFFKHGREWMLQTVSGVWEVTGDSLSARPDVLPWKADRRGETESDLALHGQHTVVQLPFKRILGADRSPVPDDDASALVDHELATATGPLAIAKGRSIPVDAFVLAAFDKITGDSLAASTYDDGQEDLGFAVFPDMAAACSYLVNDVLPRDEQVRTFGARLCHGGGIRGSGAQSRESQVTRSITAAIKKALHDALTRGYRPEHATHLKRLVQDASKILEITDIGYFGDLLFYGQADGSQVEERIDGDEPEVATDTARRLTVQRAALDGVSRVSPALAGRLRSALAEAYPLLGPDSVVIAATALEEFDTVGMRRGYDYAGISMKLSKLVERELGAQLFRRWRDELRRLRGGKGVAALRRAESEGAVNRTETVLLAFLEKKSKLDLGAMRYALAAARSPGDETSAVRLLADYLSRLAAGHWLLGSEFETLLTDISTKYRNGGVHEHVVTFEVCKEAMSRILVGPSPMLRRLLLATAGSVTP